MIKVTGKVDGKKATWSYKSDYNGTPLTIKYSGTVTDDKITADMDVDPFGVSGEFNATRSK